MFKTPKRGINTISSSSERLYFNKNIQTYIVIAPPSAPVINNFPIGFLAVGEAGGSTACAVCCKSVSRSLSRKLLTSRKA